MKEEKILLIDGNSYIHRAFHALPPLTDAAGRPVNAIYGFLRMLKKLITDEEPSHIFVAFDHKSPTFRHRDFAGYKAHRPETDKDLSEQFERLFSVLDALNIKHADYEGYEADDIIGSFTQASSDSAIKTIIVTGDKDILQLLREDVIILNGMTDKVYTATNLSDLFGVDPEYVTDYLALVGDRSDNLPGVRGVGAVTAKKLIDEYGGLENIYDQLTEIGGAVATRLENGREDAFTTRHLVTLVKDLDLPYEIEELRWEGPDARALRQEFQNLNFRKLISDWIPADELQVSLKREIILTEAELSSFLSRYDGGGFVIEICFLKDDSV
ncbi:MAG: DNA polymerase I, partial [Elusimicrobia bacterium]|nr:DNA polymerase I [Elusimicrobiota bacterium]